MTTAIVVGPQRTGTSMIAGVLDALGVNMGERMMPSNPGNPAGYYEDLDFVDLNTEILSAAGGAWDAPPSSDEIAQVVDAFRPRIHALVKAKDKAGVVWGWKDPRTALTIDLYLEAVEAPRIIICKRDTEATADSLVPFSQAFEAGVSERDKAKALTAEYTTRLDHFWVNHPELPLVRLDYDFSRRHPEFIVVRLAQELGISIDTETLHHASARIMPVAEKHNYDEMEPGWTTQAT